LECGPILSKFHSIQLVSKAMPREISGIIFDIKKFAIHDGPGIRTTVFFKGCPMQCWWCHNPESRDKNPQTVIRRVKQPGGDFLDEPTRIGYRATVSDVMREIKKDIVFYDESGGGVTFSGGESLNQPRFLTALLTICRQEGLHTAIDTCGYAEPETLKDIIPYTDLFLFDLKLMDDVEHIHYTGVSNEPVLTNLRLIIEAGKTVHLRFPIIPGITDAESNLQAMLQFIAPLPGIRQIDLLPYHKIGQHKYRQLAMEDKMKTIEPPSKKHIHQIKKWFEQTAITVSIGG